MLVANLTIEFYKFGKNFSAKKLLKKINQSALVFD